MTLTISNTRRRLVALLLALGMAFSMWATAPAPAEARSDCPWSTVTYTCIRDVHMIRGWGGGGGGILMWR